MRYDRYHLMQPSRRRYEGLILAALIVLWVDGQQERTASGQNTEELVPAGWSVAELRGRTAHLLIRDADPGPWGHIVVDDIHLARTRP